MWEKYNRLKKLKNMKKEKEKKRKKKVNTKGKLHRTAKAQCGGRGLYQQ